MKFELADTSPEMMEVWIGMLRELTTAQKLKCVFEQIDLMAGIALNDIRKEHPGISEHGAMRELATRRYGRELAELAYPTEYVG